MTVPLPNRSKPRRKHGVAPLARAAADAPGAKRAAFFVEAANPASKEAPARAAVGVQFPDNATRVEIELIAWVP